MPLRRDNSHDLNVELKAQLQCTPASALSRNFHVLKNIFVHKVKGEMHFKITRMDVFCVV